MNLKAMYEQLGYDYDGVKCRLVKEERILKFLRRIPQDPTYELLLSSVENNQLEEAFRAAHSLKGICLNLGLTGLAQSSSALTENLRGRQEITAETDALLQRVMQDYADFIQHLEQLDD